MDNTGQKQKKDKMIEETKRPTSFKSKCRIVTQFWFEFRDDPDFADFFTEHDLGPALAFAHLEGMAELTADGKDSVRSTFMDILTGFGITEDAGFKDISDFVTAEDLEAVKED